MIQFFTGSMSAWNKSKWRYLSTHLYIGLLHTYIYTFTHYIFFLDSAEIHISQKKGRLELFVSLKNFHSWNGPFFSFITPFIMQTFMLLYVTPDCRTETMPYWFKLEIFELIFLSTLILAKVDADRVPSQPKIENSLLIIIQRYRCCFLLKYLSMTPRLIFEDRIFIHQSIDTSIFCACDFWK